MQGAGAIGVAGIAGNAIVSASGNDDAAVLQDDESTAIRVAHASPDTPTVDVQVEEAGAMAGGAGGDGGNATGGNETGGDGGNATGGDGGAGGDGPMVEGLGFREVSDYNEVDPGTYQVRVVATENTGLLESIFGGDEEERVVFDEELELEQGTTYTAVAFGELAQTEGLGEQADDEGTTPTDDGEDTPTDDGVGEDTPTDDGAGAGEDTPTDDGAVGEDTPTDDGAVGEGTPTDDGMTPTDDDGVGEDTPTDDGTTPEAGDTADGQVVIEELGFGEADSFELEANDYTLQFRETAQVEGDIEGAEQEPAEDTTPGETPTDDGAGAGEDTPTDDEDDIVGEDTPTDDETTPTDDGAVGEDTPTDDGMTPGGEGEDTAEAGMQDMGFQVKLLEDDLSAPSGAGGEAGGETPADDGTATPAGNETNGNETDGDDGGILGGGDDQDGPFRLRIFHAVPDVDSMEVIAMESEDGGLLGGGDGGDENETGGTPTPDGAAGNDTGAGATPDGAAGNDTGGGGPAGTPGGTPGGVGAQEETMQETDISPNANTVYSGFAVGYFNPQAAAGQQTPAGNATGGVGDNATGTTPTDDGAMAGEDETPDDGGNVTGGDGTETETPDEITEDVEGEEFELVTVQDWSDGERADGGTGGGGILPAAAPPEAASD